MDNFEGLVRLIYIGRVTLGQRRLIGVGCLFINNATLTALFTAPTVCYSSHGAYITLAMIFLAPVKFIMQYARI